MSERKARATNQAVPEPVLTKSGLISDHVEFDGLARLTDMLEDGKWDR